ncbi:MAG TPA: efflux RND transporter periplasmic adaptor subunit, partial [Thermodesulfobacteriota bacterium]|nr:efflux RND transporter periplasmic adaptor subunit [Thermodesulfobacteriota bacterium]
APREVRVAAAVAERLPRAIPVTGTLVADEQVVVAPKVAGRLVEIAVDLGSRVRKGTVVARLDPTDFRLRAAQAEAALQQARVRLGLPPEGPDDRIDPEETALVRQARAQLDEARLTRDRMATLWEQQLVPRAQLDAAVSALLVAEGRYQDAIEEIRNRQALLAQRRSELEIARQQLADTVLYAPIDGTVRERHASAGEYVAAGAPVVSLVRTHPLRLRLAVPERAAAEVRVGQAVRVSVEGDRTVHTGRVARMSPAIDEATRTLLVEAEVPNEAGRLRPGAFARAEIVVPADRPVVLVPASAVVTFAGIEKVLTVRDGRAVELPVRTGRREGDRVEIVEGLVAGTPVVVEPGSLVGGQPVTVVR